MTHHSLENWEIAIYDLQGKLVVVRVRGGRRIRPPVRNIYLTSILIQKLKLNGDADADAAPARPVNRAVASIYRLVARAEKSQTRNNEVRASCFRSRRVEMGWNTVRAGLW